MSDVLLIRLGTTANQPISWLHWDNSNAQVVDQGELSDAEQLSQLTTLAIRTPSYALVPNELVLTTEAQLPNSSRAAREAIPFQLEEQLCEDIEQLHFATGEALEPGRFPVAVVAKRLIQQWQQWLIDAGLPVKALLADAQTLACVEQPLQLQLNQELLINTGQRQSFSIPQPEADSWISLTEAKLGQPLTLAESAGSGLESLARRFTPEQAINLLQGSYQLKDPIKQLLKTWKLPALLLVLVALLQLVTLGVENYQLQQQKQQLDQQIDTLFKQTLPNSRKVNPKSQLQQQLSQLSRQSQGSAFLQQLQHITPAYTQVKGLKILKLSYQADQSRLELELDSPNHDSLQRFISLVSNQGVEARLERSRQQGQRVYGTLMIGGNR